MNFVPTAIQTTDDGVSGADSMDVFSSRAIVVDLLDREKPTENKRSSMKLTGTRTS